MTEQIIENPRAEIDAIDRELLRLINKRGEIALRVGKAKSNRDVSLCDPTRERDVLERLSQDNQGPFEDKGIASIFQRIIDESLSLQQSVYRQPFERAAADSVIAPMSDRSSVAFLGDHGTFSEEAAMGILGEDCRTVSFPTFEDLFKAIDRGHTDYILTPLENSLIGSVRRCVDLLLESSLNIVAEIILPVSHYLIAPPDATFETIRTVESHPAALAQCERFFAAYPYLKRVAGDDTAGSVRRAINSGDVTRAGIGSKRCAAIYGGIILREHLEDNSDNFTRFALLSPTPNEVAAGGKVSLVMRLTNQPGSLHNALRPFVRRGIDLLKIESIPIRDASGQFYFYLDVQAPAVESELTGALDELREQAEDVRVLGRYSTIDLAAAK